MSKKYKKLSRSEYQARFNYIEKFLNFSINPEVDLSKQEKIIISRYYKTLRQEIENGAIIFEGTKKDVQLVAKELSRQLPRKYLKAVPVKPRTPQEKVKVVTRTITTTNKKGVKKKVKKKQIVSVKESEGVKSVETILVIDPVALMANPERYIKNALKGRKYVRGFFSFWDSYASEGFLYDRNSENAIAAFYSISGGYKSGKDLRAYNRIYLANDYIKSPQKSLDEMNKKKEQQIMKNRKAKENAREQKRKQKSKPKRKSGKNK